MLKRALLIALASATASLAVAMGCGDDGEAGTGETPVAEQPRHGLTAEQAGQVLAKIGDESITVGEFADRLAEQSPYLRARYNSPERRREFLDNMIRFELLAVEARRRGHFDNPEVVRSAKQVMIQEMLESEIEDGVQLSDISDEDIAHYYEEHRQEFQKPEQVRASHILIKNHTLAERVLGQVIANAADVSFFRQTAEQYNEDPATRDIHGDLRFFSRAADASPTEPPIPPAVRDAAFSIEQIGGIHPELVEVDGGFHIIKLTGRRAALNRTLEEARRPIQNRLLRERRDQRVERLVARLRRAARVEIDESALSQVRVQAPPGASPTVDPHGAHEGQMPVLPPPTPPAAMAAPPAGMATSPAGMATPPAGMATPPAAMAAPPAGMAAPPAGTATP